MRKSKTAASKRHFKRKFFERYGIELSTTEIKNLGEAIRTKQIGVPGIPQSKRVTLHELTFKDKNCKVIYDHKRKVVVTVLFNELDDPSIHNNSY